MVSGERGSRIERKSGLRRERVVSCQRCDGVERRVGKRKEKEKKVTGIGERKRKEEREKKQMVTGLLMSEDIADSFLFFLQKR